MHRHSVLVTIAALFSIAPSGVAQMARSGAAPVAPSLVSHAPIQFQPNLGQTSADVKFIAERAPYRMGIRASSMEYVLPQTRAGSPITRRHAVMLRWLGDSSGARWEATGLLEGTSNYFIGPDSARWVRGVPHYANVVEHNAMPGVDVRYHASAMNELEYDLIVSAGANLAAVRFAIEGSDQLSIASDGSLMIRVGESGLRLAPPRAYEVIAGESVPVDVAYVLEKNNQVAFLARRRTPGAALVIDPVILYSTQFGGSTTIGGTDATSAAYSVARDNLGNLFVAGDTDAIDFPVTPGAFDTSETAYPGTLNRVVFVSKFDTTGKYLYWSSYLSGLRGATLGFGRHLAVDGDGFVNVAGTATDGFPVTLNGFQQHCASNSRCAFLARLNARGSALAYSTLYGSPDSPSVVSTGGLGLAMGLGHDVYVTGWTWVNGLVTTPGSYQPACQIYYPPPAQDAACAAGFLVHFDPEKSGQASLLYATYLGGPNGRGGGPIGVTEADAVAVDRMGNVFVTGVTTPFSFLHVDASFGSGNGPAITRGDIDIADTTFVLKLSPDGKTTLYCALLHGVSATSIVVDAYGQAFLTGAASPGAAVTPGAAQGSPGGGVSDAFVTKLSTSGTALQYSTFLGGSGNDVGYDLAINNYGMAFVAGSTDSLNFPTRVGAFDSSLLAGTKAFVSALQMNGTALYYSSLLGGTETNGDLPNTRGLGIVVDPGWNAFVVGDTADSNFPVTANAYQPALRGHSGGFLSKIVIAADLRLSATLSATTVAPNGVVIYHARVFNGGPEGSDKVVFKNALPSGMAYAGVYVPNGNGCTEPRQGATSGTLTCRRTRLERGETYYVNVYLRAVGKAGTTVTNQMTVSAQTQDPWPNGNSVSAVVSIK